MRFEEYIVELPSERFCPRPVKVGAAAPIPRDGLGAPAPAPRDDLGALAPAPRDCLGAPAPAPRNGSERLRLFPDMFLSESLRLLPEMVSERMRLLPEMVSERMRPFPEENPLRAFFVFTSFTRSTEFQHFSIC